MIYRVLIFLVLNFGALAIGGLFTNAGVHSDWYVNLDKAPWTPPGWFFGFAWTLIMVCFTVYMSFQWNVLSKKKIGLLYGSQWILNVLWNPIFFYFNYAFLGFVWISILTVLMGYFTFYLKTERKWLRFLVLPYFIWLVIASTLNGYILFYN